MLELQHPDEPKHLAEYRADHPAIESPKKAWDDFHRHAQSVYNEVKDSLVDMQRGLCVYCERRLDQYPSSTVEHIEPRSHNPKLVFTYTNLAACCSGGKPSHCGDSKKDHHLHIKPYSGCNDNFYLDTTTGKLRHSRTELRVPVSKDISLLNLNATLLMEKRKARIDEMRTQVEELIKRQSSLSEIASHIRSEYENGEFPSCVRQVFARFFE